MGEALEVILWGGSVGIALSILYIILITGVLMPTPKAKISRTPKPPVEIQPLPYDLPPGIRELRGTLGDKVPIYVYTSYGTRLDFGPDDVPWEDRLPRRWDGPDAVRVEIEYRGRRHAGIGKSVEEAAGHVLMGALGIVGKADQADAE